MSRRGTPCVKRGSVRKCSASQSQLEGREPGAMGATGQPREEPVQPGNPTGQGVRYLGLSWWSHDLSTSHGSQPWKSPIGRRVNQHGGTARDRATQTTREVFWDGCAAHPRLASRPDVGCKRGLSRVMWVNWIMTMTEVPGTSQLDSLGYSYNPLYLVGIDPAKLVLSQHVDGGPPCTYHDRWLMVDIGYLSWFLMVNTWLIFWSYLNGVWWIMIMIDVG